MVYGLINLALRRNLSVKTLKYTEFLGRRKSPFQILSFTYCQKNKEREGSGKKETEPRAKFADGKGHLNYIIEQAKKGKVSFVDLQNLAERVIVEGQFKNYTQAPSTIQYVGFAGLLPMVGFPIMNILSGHACSSLVYCHLAYGATVLSFLGGSGWYDSISKNEISYEKLGWVIAPQLIGWMSLMLPLPLGILCTSLGFCLSLVHDIILSSYPQWMKSLRLVLTAGTLASFLIMFLVYLIL